MCLSSPVRVLSQVKQTEMKGGGGGHLYRRTIIWNTKCWKDRDDADQFLTFRRKDYHGFFGISSATAPSLYQKHFAHCRSGLFMPNKSVIWSVTDLIKNLFLWQHSCDGAAVTMHVMSGRSNCNSRNRDKDNKNRDYKQRTILEFSTYYNIFQLIFAIKVPEYEHTFSM